MNPYQGCEHGCAYCYARLSHTFWGYSAGLDFESKILVKKNAAELLQRKLKSPRWKAALIMMSGNTDPYQPVEQKLKISRSLLEVCWRYRNPVGVITKNALVERDIDILQQLASKKLTRVAISITTLDESLRRVMEPRTSTAEKKLSVIEKLSAAGIPVHVMVAPIIPGLNDTEIWEILHRARNAGALTASYVMVRLNGEIGDIFRDWLFKNFPDRAEKVIRKISSLHGGSLADHRTGRRFKGDGVLAEMLQEQFKMAYRKIFKDAPVPYSYNLDLHAAFKSDQLNLFH